MLANCAISVLAASKRVGFRGFTAAVAGQQGGIGFVGLVVAQAAVGVGLDLGGVDYADDVPGLVQKLGQPIAVDAGRFQAGVHMLDLVAFQPLDQLLEALGRVVKCGLAVWSLTSW